MSVERCGHADEDGTRCREEVYRDGLCNKHWFRRYRGRDMDRSRVLTEAQIKYIQTSQRPARQLAMQFGCSASRVRAIRLKYQKEKLSN